MPEPEAARQDRVCIHCGYGVAASRTPEACPMCGGSEWESLRRSYDYEFHYALAYDDQDAREGDAVVAAPLVAQLR